MCIEKYSFSNFLKLSNLVGIVWNLDKEIKSRILYFASSIAYVCHILYKTNYRRIIKENNKLISFLATKEYGSNSFFRYFYLMMCFISNFIMIRYKDGRSILKYQLAYNKLFDKMKDESNNEYDAELVLFITQLSYKGKGYGKYY